MYRDEVEANNLIVFGLMVLAIVGVIALADIILFDTSTHLERMSFLMVIFVSLLPVAFGMRVKWLVRRGMAVIPKNLFQKATVTRLEQFRIEVGEGNWRG